MDTIEKNLSNVFLAFQCTECGKDIVQEFVMSQFYKKNEADIDTIVEYIESHLSFDEIDNLCNGEEVTIVLPPLVCSNKECIKSGLKKRKTQLIESINVPPLYKNVLPIKSFAPGVLNTPGIFIIGKVGAGKTYMAVSMLKKLVLEGQKVKQTSYKFINVSTLFLQLQENMRSNIKEGKSILRKCMDVDFLVLDDLGTEKSSDWNVSQMYVLINERLEQQKFTIITSNLSSISDIETAFSERLSSRFSLYTAMEALGNDRRKNN